MNDLSKPKGHFAIMRRLIAGGFLNIAGIGFTIYILVICYPGVVASSDMLLSLRAGEISMSDAGENNLHVAVPAVCAALFLFARHGVLSILQNQQILLIALCIFSSIIIFLSIVSGTAPTSLAQVAQYLLTIIVFFSCLCFWQAPATNIDNALAMACISLVGILLAGALFQGFHDYRWVGLIHPNHYARYAYIALVLHSLVMRRVLLPALLLAFVAAYMVSARTIMIGILLFYAGYVLLSVRGIAASSYRHRTYTSTLALCALAAALISTLGFLFINNDQFLNRLSADFAVFDTDRGILSGFTGRSDSWSAFFDTMPSFVMFGYGFRSSRYELHNVHSGVLSYFMDFGMVLGGLLLAAVIGRSIYLIIQGRTSRNSTELICGLALVTTLIIQCFEPDNFNIGFIGSFFFMLILAYTPPMLSSQSRQITPRRRDKFHFGNQALHQANQEAFRK